MLAETVAQTVGHRQTLPILNIRYMLLDCHIAVGPALPKILGYRTAMGGKVAAGRVIVHLLQT